MPPLPINWRTILYHLTLLIVSSIFCSISFWIGRIENINRQHCDPFQLIRNPLPSSPPAIDSLLKKPNSLQ